MFDNYLQFRQQPLDLNAENPSPMKLFVLTQAALMEKGHSRKAAYNIVEAEFNKALAGSVAQLKLCVQSLARCPASD